MYSFTRTRQPQAGTQSYAFQGHGSPRVTVLGAGTGYVPKFSPFTSSPLYYPSVLAPLGGLGGLIYRTQYFGPLIVTDSSS